MHEERVVRRFRNYMLFLGGVASCISAVCCLEILRNCLYQEFYSKGKISVIKKYGSLKHLVQETRE